MTKVATVQAQQKWDYCFELRRTDNALLIVLSELGQRGWELVNVLHHKDPKGETTWTACLKRPSVGQSPAPRPASRRRPSRQKSPPAASRLRPERRRVSTEDPVTWAGSVCPCRASGYPHG